MADAARVLDDLAAHDRLSMEVEDDGTIVYEMPGRQQLAALAPAATPPAPESRALIRAVEAPRHPRSPTLAAVLAGILPGAGHLYAGRITAAVMWFVVVSLGYALILPGLILHLFCMASAASAARRLAPAAPLALLAA
jgi:hypothetical protein